MTIFTLSILSAVSALLIFPILPIKRSAPIYPIKGIKGLERVLKGLKGLFFFDSLDSSDPYAPAHLNQRTISREKGCRCNARRISRRWTVLKRTAHCWDNLLAAADAPLSREISCQKGLDLAYRKSEHPRIVLKRTASGAQL